MTASHLTLAIGYIALGLMILIGEVARQARNWRLDLFALFNIAYITFFVLAPIHVLLQGDLAVRQKYAYEQWGYGDFSTLLVLSATYVCAYAGHYAAARRSRKPLSIAGKILQPPPRVVYGATIFCSFVGTVGLLAKVQLSGGPLQALLLAPGFRTGEVVTESRLLALTQLALFIPTAFMLAFAYYIECKRGIQATKSSTVKPGLLLVSNAFLFLYFSLISFGRREFLLPIAVCALVWLAASWRRAWGVLGLIIVMSALWGTAYFSIIPSAYAQASTDAESKWNSADASATTSATAALAPPQAVDISGNYWASVQGLNDSFMHFVAAQNMDFLEFGFFRDVWEIPAQMLPMHLLGLPRDRGVYALTSERILGRPLEPGLSGEETLGLHGYLVVNASAIGACAGFYLLGWLLGVGDGAFRSIALRTAVSWMIMGWIAVAFIALLRDGALILILKPWLSWWLVLMAFAVYPRSGQSRLRLHEGEWK